MPSLLKEHLPMNVILEEDESSLSSTHSATLGVKARRRQGAIALSRLFPVEKDSLPTTPDSFKLTFTNASFEFPHPPIPTPSSYLRQCDSPTSSLSSSPGSQTEGMPLTPSTSDDESGPFQRPVIQPLVITKHNPQLFNDDCPVSPSLLQPFKPPLENPSAPLSPEEYLDQDSEFESDSEWYTKEFSKIISLRSPIPPSFPLHTRPDSMSISSAEIACSRRRVSKPLPPTPFTGGFPSAQLDPTFSRRGGSKRRSIPTYPPPPIPSRPSFPTQLTPPSSSSILSHSDRRPPPRSSIPADCVYDFADAEDDSSSTFSFSIYDVYLGDGPDELDSPPSSYSQSSLKDSIDGLSFDHDYPLVLPLSLPGTPCDLEADIAQGLEQLRNSPDNVEPPVWLAVTTDSIVQPETRERVQRLAPKYQQQQPLIDDVFSSPSSSTFPSHPHYDSPTTSPYINEDKTLKSKWSTSTLNSIREEHEKHGASAKLRLYLKGHSPLKITKQGSSSRSKKTLTNPLSLSRKAPALAASSPSKATQAHHVRVDSDVMVIGYGNGNGGMRRRGSVANSVSDAGSEESCSSTSSSGLRRKPIPVEMFLRGAA